MGGQGMEVLFLQRPLQAFVTALPQALHFWIRGAQHESHPLPSPDLFQQVE